MAGFDYDWIQMNAKRGGPPRTNPLRTSTTGRAQEQLGRACPSLTPANLLKPASPLLVQSALTGLNADIEFQSILGVGMPPRFNTSFESSDAFGFLPNTDTSSYICWSFRTGSG
jgi:hypothetical protein